jgi:NAD(P)-dependent dehydrogenase (short-subunit alcohol dehydrogenase family)
MASSTVLITGASTGIGRAAAEYFQAMNWNVAATMRSPEKEQELNQLPNLKCIPLDVCDEASVRRAIQTTIETFGSIDVIVNNAGYGAVGAFEAASPEQVKKQFDTNVFGLMNVVREILPHFRGRRKGIIINVASIAGQMTWPLYSLYHATKWAVEGFSESLQFELKQFGIRVKIIEPGAIKTDFYSRSQDLFHKQGLDTYNEYVDLVMPNLQQAGAEAPGPEIVAAKIYRAATDNRAKLRYPVGSNAPFLLFFRRIAPGRLFRAAVAWGTERRKDRLSKYKSE